MAAQGRTDKLGMCSKCRRLSRNPYGSEPARDAVCQATSMLDVRLLSRPGSLPQGDGVSCWRDDRPGRTSRCG
ncbi:hypothetical protein FHJ31_05415 [Pseudomonas sp. Fig-3]|nr:hypothetical protein FHJ31_05415 [Pseudomonas sp. Fig-3]